MSKLWARFAGIFSSKNFIGIDKAGNRYFKRTEELDGVMKEKRWVTFKGEEDPTSIPVEWICWLNGQRKSAPTPEEMAELEARREFVKLNIARLKKEEEERKAKEGKRKATNIGKADGPDLKSFVQQFPDASEGDKTAETSDTQNEKREVLSVGVLGKLGRPSEESGLWSLLAFCGAYGWKGTKDVFMVDRANWFR
ncbi:uncharacterized protein LOC132618181 isoform X3 [Lycium barbarum]|uniref:uncharacterized protein LOC132618181 isoform X3 n=1 Tax=Lycium barbarum TaxID=112863 RepID=UPI00293E4D9B|nr:uncharacterized protein LOC132618181 isoform X3 [Lycium barbarum]